jgi:hypothetical protein
MAVVKGKPTPNVKSGPPVPMPDEANAPTPESKLADFSKAKDAKDAAAKVEKKAAKVRKDGLNDLPPLPRAKKAKPPKKCGCGCGSMTRGGDFVPGHDGRPKGWAIRVERGIVKLADVPDGERVVVAALLKTRKAEAAKAVKAQPEPDLETESESEDADVEGDESESGSESESEG